jgi:hypothetical protein
VTRTFSTFIAPAVLATAVFAGTAADAAYIPEAQRILDVVAQTGTTITHKVCAGEDAGSFGFYELHTDDDNKVTKDELTVCTDQAKGPAYLETIKHETIHVAQACQGYKENVSGRTDKWLRKQLKKFYGEDGYASLEETYDKEHLDIELEAFGMESRPTAEIIEVVQDACAFYF